MNAQAGRLAVSMRRMRSTHRKVVAALREESSASRAVDLRQSHSGRKEDSSVSSESPHAYDIRCIIDVVSLQSA